MRRSLVSIGLAAVGTVGCAHHQANQYSYAPPLAPPVYPQPQQPAPPALPAGAVVPPALPPGAVMSAPVMGHPVSAAGAVDPCCQPAGGPVVVQPVVYADGQTPPCPPAP